MSFWKDKTLGEMTQAEWESLCDGCGRCCLHKLEDEDTGEIITTTIACHLLDCTTCRCSDYPNRHMQVKNCLNIRALPLRHYHWLPETCAYRRLQNNQGLPDWHPLISQTEDSVYKAGISVRDICTHDTRQKHR